jgi:hypothetical protein
MTVPMVHQESEDRSLCDEPSLFIEEWYERCADLIRAQIAQGVMPSKAVCREWRQIHPPVFLGLWASLGVPGYAVLDPLPPLRYEGDQLWIEPSWGIERPHPVEVVRVPRHRLVILVAVDSLLVLRESELVEALGGSSPAPAERQIGGAR